MGKWILMWYALQSKLSMLLKQVSCLKKGGSMSKGPDIISLIHFCQSRGVYLAPGPLTIFRVSVTHHINVNWIQDHFKFTPGYHWVNLVRFVRIRWWNMNCFAIDDLIWVRWCIMSWFTINDLIYAVKTMMQDA